MDSLKIFAKGSGNIDEYSSSYGKLWQKGCRLFGWN